VKAALLILFALILAGCYTTSDTLPGPGEPTPAVPESPGRETDAPGTDAAATDAAAEAEPGDLTARQLEIIAAARLVLETQSTVVGDTTYSYDCSGTILTIFARAGIYLVDLFPRYTGNGVARIHGIAADYGLLHDRNLPEPGDVVFWDNTYDRNGDGDWNDPLTHAGVVIGVDEDGTVEYVHHNYRRGIVTASMNLLDPEVYQDTEGAEVNSPMRMASQRDANPDLWLSSHLFREFASMYRIQLGTASTGGAATVASTR
jgi:hypothetical protein